MLRLFLPIVISLAMSSGVFGRQAMLTNKADDPKAAQWADSVYSSLSPRQRVAQLVFPKVNPTQGDNSKSSLRRLVDKDGVGGLIFTAGTLAQYVEMTNYAQSLAQVPLLMTFDGEWGLSMRISDTPKYPCNMALGAISDTAILADYGREMARQCRLAGIQVNFAPVLDVNSNPRNPVIGYRSFGEDPCRVAALGTAYSRGLEQGGVQAVGKHFPGHGDTSTDSHKQQTTVSHSWQTLNDIDLVPFRSFINAGGSGIMVGHIVVPAVDPSGRPATLSPILTDTLLRSRLGFRGLIYTDALEMKGVRHQGLNPALESLRAGADVLLSSLTPQEDINTIMRALDDGSLSWSVIEDRCKRILRYKYAIGMDAYAPIDINGLQEKIHAPSAQAVNDALAQASITLLRNDGNLLPLANLAKSSIAIVNIGAPANNNFAELCSRYTHVDIYSTNDGNISAADLSAIRRHDVVVAAIYSDSASSLHAFGQLAHMPRLAAVFMLNPYKMSKFRTSLPAAKAVMLAYENLPESRAAAAMALFGGIEVSGHLPVNLNGIATMGTGIHLPKSRLGYATPTAVGFRAQLTDSLDAVVARTLADKAFPGCQLLVAKDGFIVHEKAYGRLTDGGTPVDLSTLYDLASVSKTTGTLPGIMKAYDLGLFDLDKPAATYIPPLAEYAKDFTPREMLFHETGMPASVNAYQIMMDSTSYTGKLFKSRRDADHTIYLMKNSWGHKDARLRRDITAATRSDINYAEAAKGIWVGQAAFDTIMGRIYASQLRPSKKYNYSCLNFCLLMDMEQRLTGIPHQQWVADSIFGPLGASDICYRPTERFPLSRIAPTENDPFMRRQLVHGYVHDETAAMLGGVSGNAGLFANAGDLAKLCQMWLNGGSYGDARILSQATVDLFTTTKSPTCRRGLGFDKPDTKNPDASPTCDEASPAVYGHTGFTGTVFWVDPDQNLIFIFLTNRVNPTRDNAAFSRSNVRPELFRQVYKAL